MSNRLHIFIENKKKKRVRRQNILCSSEDIKTKQNKVLCAESEWVKRNGMECNAEVEQYTYRLAPYHYDECLTKIKEIRIKCLPKSNKGAAYV